MHQVTPATRSSRQKDKAKEFFGLDKIDKSLAVTVQIQGSIFLKERQGKFKRKFGVVKDGFFIWYDKNPGENKATQLSFDRKPCGLFPLNSCFLKHHEEDYEIEMRHYDIPNAAIGLKFKSPIDSGDWHKCLLQGSESTWEKARLGAVELERMKEMGSKLEQEKLEAGKELERKIHELEEATKKKNELLQKDKLQREKFEKQFGEAKESLRIKECQLQELEKQYKRETLQMQSMNLKNRDLEQKLNLAHKALTRLDRELQKYFNHEIISGEKRNSRPPVTPTNLLSSGRSGPKRPQRTIKDNAVDALQTAIVQSSPQMRHGKMTQLVSDMSVFRLPEPKYSTQSNKKSSFKDQRSRPSGVSRTTSNRGYDGARNQMQMKVSRQVVAQSVAAIQDFIDLNRSTQLGNDSADSIC